MNKYLRSIGFSKIKSLHQMDLLQKEILHSPDHRTISGFSLSSSLVQLDKLYSPGTIGLSVIGEMDSTGSFSFEHVFPFVTPDAYTFSTDLSVEQRGINTSYSGVIDNVSLSIIFYIQNIAYIGGQLWNNRLPKVVNVALSGLSTEGTILLPLMKTQQEQEYDFSQLQMEKRAIQRFRDGDDAIYDKIVLREMGIKEILDNRMYSEDILSIVDHGMIPYGTESDVFTVIGTILTVKDVENSRTREHIYLLDIQCLYYVIRIAINREDLTGEPAPGRRFRGVIWLQGAVRS